MDDEIPVACCLSDEEMRNREATLLAQFKSALVTTEEVSDGYLFRIPGDKKWDFTSSRIDSGTARVLSFPEV